MWMPRSIVWGETLTRFKENKQEIVVAFVSKKRSPAKQNYTAYDREPLSHICFLERFCCYLERL